MARGSRKVRDKRGSCDDMESPNRLSVTILLAGLGFGVGLTGWGIQYSLSRSGAPPPLEARPIRDSKGQSSVSRRESTTPSLRPAGYQEEITLDSARRYGHLRQSYLERISKEMGVRVLYDPYGAAFVRRHTELEVKYHRVRPDRGSLSFIHKRKLESLAEDGLAVPSILDGLGHGERDGIRFVYVFRRLFTYGFTPLDGGEVVPKGDIEASGTAGCRFLMETDDDLRSLLYHEKVHLRQVERGVEAGTGFIVGKDVSRMDRQDRQTLKSLSELQAYCAQLSEFGDTRKPRMNVMLWIHSYELARRMYGAVGSAKPRNAALSWACSAYLPLAEGILGMTRPPIFPEQDPLKKWQR